jgi:hypothetical protein
LTQEISGVDYTSYQQNADAFDAVIQQSIVDSVPGITQSDIYDFFVTAGSRRLQSAVPKKAENDAPRAEDVVPSGRDGDAKDSASDAARAIAPELPVVVAPAVDPERRANLRSEAGFHTAAASIVAQYKIILTGSGQSYEQVSNNIQAAVETGQFDTAMRENAVAAGVPELANATSSTITTVDVGGTDDSSGDGSGSSAALSLPVIVGVAVGCGAVIGMLIAAFYFYCIRPPSGTSQRTMAHSRLFMLVHRSVAWIVALALLFRFHYVDPDLFVLSLLFCTVPTPPTTTTPPGGDASIAKDINSYFYGDGIPQVGAGPALQRALVPTAPMDTSDIGVELGLIPDHGASAPSMNATMDAFYDPVLPSTSVETVRVAISIPVAALASPAYGPAGNESIVIAEVYVGEIEECKD